MPTLRVYHLVTTSMVRLFSFVSAVVLMADVACRAVSGHGTGTTGSALSRSLDLYPSS